jgi:FixJ family two-component response regulator
MNHLRLRVAVIDGDASVRKALNRLLGAANLDADTFASARDFLDSLASNRPDCIVLDFQMPDMNAADVQRQLTREGMPAPIIVVFGLDDLQYRAQCMSAGAVAYLCKPFDGEELLDAIHRAVGGAISAGP